MIKIKTEKEVNSAGVLGRRIVEIKALQYNDLPDLYRKDTAGFHLSTLNNLLLMNVNYSAILREGEFVPEDKYQVKLAAIKIAGEFLHKTNQRLKVLRESWNGEETFEI
jgi:hypothetical protein